VTEITTQKWNHHCTLLPRARPAIGLAGACPVARLEYRT
jgi:hypothetical protein